MFDRGPEQIMLNQKTVTRFLAWHGKMTVLDIRFKLAGKHGEVYSSTAVSRVLKALKKTRKVVNQGDFWQLTPETRKEYFEKA